MSLKEEPPESSTNQAPRNGSQEEGGPLALLTGILDRLEKWVRGTPSQIPSNPRIPSPTSPRSQAPRAPTQGVPGQNATSTISKARPTSPPPVVIPPPHPVEVPEEEVTDPKLKECLEVLKGDYDKGIYQIQANGDIELSQAIDWVTVRRRLLEPNTTRTATPPKTNLELAADMEGGARLFGVDAKGRFLIADRTPNLIVLFLGCNSKCTT